MESQSNLEQVVTLTLIEHYQANSPGLIDLVKQLLVNGFDPVSIEAIVQQHCPPGSAVAAHAYLLAVHYGGALAGISGQGLILVLSLNIRIIIKHPFK